MMDALRTLGAFPGLLPEVAGALTRLEANVRTFSESVRFWALQRFSYRGRVVTSADSPYSAQVGECVLVNTTVAAVTVRVPKADGTNEGQPIAVREVAGANNITIDPVDDGEIDGASSRTLTSAFSAVICISCGRSGGWRSF